jgi:hypothetical protein
MRTNINRWLFALWVVAPMGLVWGRGLAGSFGASVGAARKDHP